MKKFFRYCLIAALALPCTLFARRDEGLLLYMNFDDVTEPEKNITGGERTASLLGTSPSAMLEKGKFVNSAVFMNNNGRSEEPNRYVFNLGELDGYYEGSFSVAFWFKTDLTGARKAMISGNKDWNNPNKPGWAITAEKGKSLSLSVGGTNVDIDFPALTNGDWHHVALVVNRSSGSVSFFGDGKLLSSKKIPAGKIGHDKETLVGGSGSAAFSAPGHNDKKAYIDDYAVWTRPLTEKEVGAMWDEGQGARVPEPSAFPLMFGGIALATVLLVRRRHRNAK